MRAGGKEDEGKVETESRKEKAAVEALEEEEEVLPRCWGRDRELLLLLMKGEAEGERA